MNLQTWGVSLAVFLPLVGAMVLTALPKEWGATNRAHFVAGIFTAAPLAIVALMATQFNYHSGRMQFEVNASWIPTIGARYPIQTTPPRVPTSRTSRSRVVAARVCVRAPPPDPPPYPPPQGGRDKKTPAYTP